MRTLLQFDAWKVAWFGTRASRDIRVKCATTLAGSGSGNAHQRDDQYAEFPSTRDRGDGGPNARFGESACGGRPGRRLYAQRRVDSGFFRRMESPRLSLVRAACIGPW